MSASDEKCADAAFEPCTRVVTQELINAFHESFGGSNPIHTDASAAKETEYGAPVQHGIRTMYPIFSMLVKRYGRQFLENGTMSVKFVVPVMAGDVITTHIVAGPETGRSNELQIWGEKADGTKVLIGSASVGDS